MRNTPGWFRCTNDDRRRPAEVEIAIPDVGLNDPSIRQRPMSLQLLAFMRSPP